MIPQPCRYCGELVSRDVQGQLFATHPGNPVPWTCPDSSTLRHVLLDSDLCTCGRHPHLERLAHADGCTLRAEFAGPFRVRIYSDGSAWRAGAWILHRDVFGDIAKAREAAEAQARTGRLVRVTTRTSTKALAEFDGRST